MTLWINGGWVTELGERRVKTSPVSDDVLWHGNDVSATQVTQACQTARAAFVGWAKQSFSACQAIIEEFALLLGSNKAELTQIITKETGKPHWKAATELMVMINGIAISVRAYHARTGEQYSELLDGAAALRHRPHGVLAVSGPYSLPDHLSNGHIVPVLLVGNTLTFKPNELTPWTSEAVTKLWEQAGLPPGALNLIQDRCETGRALNVLKDLNGLLFTGSTSTGYQLHKQLSDQPEKILALKMGSNNPLIVENLENIDAAVYLTIQSAFVTTGQHCTYARRLLIKKGAQGDAFLTCLVEVNQRLVPGNWDAQPQPFMDGLTSEQVTQYVHDAWQHLASLGGRTLLAPCLVNVGASLLTPGITELTGAGSVPDEGVFDPLFGVRRYDSFDDAIRLVNNARSGLSYGLVSPDRGQFEQPLLETWVEIANWNKPLTGATSTAPLGGIGASGSYRANA